MNKTPLLTALAAAVGLAAACSSTGSDPSGRGGSGAAAGTSAKGGSGGAAAARGGSGGASGKGGAAGAWACDTAECFRPYECKRSCGGAIEYSGCCACEAPLFDDFEGMACGGHGGAASAGPGSGGGDAGVANATYLGCGYIGGYDRLSLAKVDTARDLCVYVRFKAPGAFESPGLTLWNPSWGAEALGAGPAAACTTHSLFTVTTGSVMGTVTGATTTSEVPTKVSFDLVLTFPAGDAGAGFSERMTATDLAVPGGGCTI
jgi:hypothetical protein